MNYREREPVLVTISELKPQMKNITLTFKVLAIGQEKEVTSRQDGQVSRVADAIIGDETGTVVCPLWNDSIDEVKHGISYKLENGYTGTFQGKLRLNIGRYGKLAESNQPIDEVDESLDMSVEEHEDLRYRSDNRHRGNGQDRRNNEFRGGSSGGRRTY